MGLLKGRDFITLMDFKPEDIRWLLEVSRHVKIQHLAGIRRLRALRGKSLAMLFEKPSTRTRFSLELAARQLGMDVSYAPFTELQLGRGETIADTARVLDRYFDAVAARVQRHETLVEMAEHARIPVINALSDREHPLQALADALTVWEATGSLAGAKVAFVGDGGNNVAHALLLIGSMLGWDVRIVAPRRFWPRRDYLDAALEFAKRSGGNVTVTEDLNAVEGVDIIYTDVWVSMGMEAEAEERRALLRRYQVNEELMMMAGPRARFMHCLPARRGEEVVDSVIDGPRSLVWDQAENRLYTAKALLLALLA